MYELNIRARSSRALSLRRCKDQLRIVPRIALSAVGLAAGPNETPMPPGLLAHKSRPESVAEKVELVDRMSASPTFIPAIEPFGLVRMKRQPTISKTRVQSVPKRHRLVLGPTMTDRVVSITLKRNVREIPTHPHVKRVVKKEVCQERADYPALWRSSFSGRRTSRRWCPLPTRLLLNPAR